MYRFLISGFLSNVKKTADLFLFLEKELENIFIPAS